ncbi:MAG TPA: hypothetical protein VN181_09575 [Thermoanaerobaculia bacterium]|nr:hypothetical protein [Thermoanaerobaculia bacterium]
MKVVILSLLVALTVPLSAERRRAVAPPSGVLSIEFVDVPSAQTAAVFAAGPDGWIDLATVSQAAGATGSSLHLRRRFALRIVRSGELSWGTVKVTAMRDVADARSTVRIDGKLLSSTPLVIDARAAVGTVIIHTLEIAVPESAAPGPLNVSISWQATSQ